MPVYEYRCLTCDDRFERRATVGDADDARCPSGHTDTKRLLSVFAMSRAATASRSVGPPASGGGGCCGGACGCG